MRACINVALSSALLLGLPVAVEANGDPIASISDDYAAPAESIRLADGRALNLRCSGEGRPVVMLEAGGKAESSTWFRVQPELARMTRTCAYDRAGHGFSDEGPMPRDLEADVADLHALIDAAGIPAPVLLVGHSLGSNIVRRFAQTYPTQVAGMVLLDPPEQGGDERMPPEWQAQIAAGLAQREVLLGACENAAVAGDSDTLQRCLREPPAWMGERVAAATRHNKSLPSYWRTLRSELAHNIAVFSAPVPADESYGDIPLRLLRPAVQDQDAPAEVRAVIEAARRETHARILAASTQAIEIEVPDTSHDIQLDQPGAVVSAVRQLLESGVGADAAPAGG